ncbi:MAG TPA: hypothetical protein EYQ85_07455 [Candidatus Poseidoniales archaeon]|nr:MAG: hypothetical protein CXT68_03605 [Euryarchaeota archaeon]HIF17066.1 hypothetical protein [Candidatus Poseidoniales archaeon]
MWVLLHPSRNPQITRAKVRFVEEVPNREAGSGIGDSYLYKSEEGIWKGSRSRALMSVLRGLGWNLAAPLHIEPCQFGLSNHNYKIFCGDFGPLLLRIFGPSVGDTNPDERHIQDSGFGAHVVQRLDWGRLETWLPGRTMQRGDCDNNQMLAALAHELRRLHTVAGRNHNDLNFTNVLVCDSVDSLVIHLLDFEYAGPLDPPFDVANFFCEWMYDYQSPRWFEPDSTRFPSDAQARSFVAQYLEITDCTDGEVSAFLKEVQTRIPSVHTFWIDWAMKNFSDLDEYVQYAEQRQILVK